MFVHPIVEYRLAASWCQYLRATRLCMTFERAPLPAIVSHTILRSTSWLRGMVEVNDVGQVEVVMPANNRRIPTSFGKHLVTFDDKTVFEFTIEGGMMLAGGIVVVRNILRGSSARSSGVLSLAEAGFA